MITLAQRIEQLRTDAGYSRAGLASALGFPKGAFDKFETGRATPTKEQQAKIADFFSVSLFYLRGESNDPTRQEDWIDMPGQSQGPQGRRPRPGGGLPAGLPPLGQAGPGGPARRGAGGPPLPGGAGPHRQGGA